MYELYYTKLGHVYVGDSCNLLASIVDNSVDLIITSPPFALQRKKEYGNRDQDKYVDWLVQFGHDIFRVLKETGSFVLDIGGAYKKRRPVRSLYNFRVLIRMCDDCGFNLAEEFFCTIPPNYLPLLNGLIKEKLEQKILLTRFGGFQRQTFPKRILKKFWCLILIE